MSSLSELAAALRAADTPYIYGLGGLSMEEQREAVALARACGGVISIPRLISPTLTIAGLKAFDLLLTAGGDLPPDITFEGTILRDDRLLEAESWRCLMSLYRGTPIPGAASYGDLKALLDGRERAVLLWMGGPMDDRTLRALRRFASESYDLSILQIPALPNALGAFEIMLEECGDCAAYFRDGECITGGALEGISGKCDLILRIGEVEVSPEGEAPRYALAMSGEPCERVVEAASRGGTYLRFDGVPVPVKGASAGPSYTEILRALKEEVTA